jgi:chromosome segregation ATPase
MLNVSSAQEDELNLEKIRLEEVRGPSGPAQATSPEAPETGPEDVISALARTIARALGSAIEQLERHDRQESRALQDSVRDQGEKLNAAIEGLFELTKKMGQLTDAISEQKATNNEAQRQNQQLSAALASIQEAEARHEDELKTVRLEMVGASAPIYDRVDALALRIELQDESLRELKLTVSEVSPRVAALFERMDRQASAIRATRETQAQREGALDQLAGVLERLRGSAACTVDVQELNTL